MSGTTKWSLQVTTPLGPDALALERLEGEEHVSAPFHLRLSLSASKPVDATRLLGKAACVTLIDGDGNKRYLNGITTRFAQTGDVCAAELRPWLWLLSLFSDNRIFQAKSVPDIVTAVFSGAGFTDYRNDLRHTYKPLDYCVQYRETNLAFVSRLMESAGIFYFFEHTDSAHTLVLGDDPASFQDCENAASLAYLPLGAPGDWLSDLRVNSVACESEVAVQSYLTDDFNFTVPATNLSATTGDGTRRVYDYPGGYDTVADGEDLAKRRMDALSAVGEKRVRGESPVRGLRAGGAFTLTGHPDKTLNARHALRTVTHMAARREYANSFVAFPAATPFRPPLVTPPPRIGGSQTAIVVGPSGKEIYTDKYGRVKVQFHWDQQGKNDENSSCWIRVAQTWAGVNWGAFTLPRIGQEVVVTFLDGDPDRPLITGCVYNGDNPVPYALPEDQTKTVLKSNSSEGGGGSNEFTLEDKKGSEQIYVHAQKDLVVDVLNDQTVTITQNRGVTLSQGNDTLTISEGNRTATISKGNDSLTVAEGNRTVAISKGNETLSVQGTRGVTVTGAETHTNKANFTQSVSGNFSQSVSGNFTLSVDGDITIKASGALTLQSGTGLTITAGTALTASAGTTASVKAGTGLTLQSSTSFTLQGGASGTINGGGMLSVKGGMVQLN
jgi:type VI secretion system secreted protein VgrG